MGDDSDEPSGTAAEAKTHRKPGKPVKKRPPKRRSGPQSRPFPKIALERALTVPRAIEEKNAGKPAPAEDLAKMVGFRQVADWRFRDLLRAAYYYGLVTGTSIGVPIGLTQEGTDIVSPSSPDQRQKALLKAFHSVDVFKKVHEYYAGKRMPDDEYFANSLVRDFSVPRELVGEFIQVFGDNLRFVQSFSGDTSSASHSVVSNTDAAPAPASDAPKEVRKFLDTCFVLMPFGEWFDRYYKEIYSPAIRDAGFEPMRADGIFNTGAVMEQIWNHITSSDVLLAELTDKNPNVFYELGLAHARRKPVVFVSGNLDDVPFDLRHLRVVLYDIREPNWAEQLRSNIALYLKNAKTEPEKSIPQPYRARRAEDKARPDEDDELDESEGQ